jgi:tetratricopeptide (TPR) repeat protein
MAKILYMRAEKHAHKPATLYNPQLARTLFQCAEAEEGRGNSFEALKLYEQAAIIDPAHAETQLNLGLIYYKLGYRKKAEECFRKAIIAAPSYARAHFNLARCLEDMGFQNEAEQHYLKALQFNPHYGDAHFNLGLFYSGISGREMDAIRHFRSHIKLGDEPKWVKASQKEVSRMHAKLKFCIVPKPPNEEEVES